MHNMYIQFLQICYTYLHSIECKVLCIKQFQSIPSGGQMAQQSYSARDQDLILTADAMGFLQVRFPPTLQRCLDILAFVNCPQCAG